MKDVVHATVIEIIEIMKYIARTYADATEDEYNAAAREALAAAIARSSANGGGFAAQAAPAPEPATVELTAPLLPKSRHSKSVQRMRSVSAKDVAPGNQAL